MANYFNLLAGLLTFLGSSALAYALWNPVNDFLVFFPTTLYVLCAGIWTAVLFVAIAYLPFIMIVSDDRGV